MQLVWASGRALPEALPRLRGIFGDRLRLGPQGPAGFQLVEVGGPSWKVLAFDLAPLGPSVSIDSPIELTEALADIGRNLLELYGSPTR